MRILAIIIGLFLILIILQDSFESIVLPRRVSRRFRLSRLFYVSTWVLWSSLARKMRAGKRGEVYRSYYGPLSLILMLVVWAAALICAFGLLQWGMSLPMNAPEKEMTLGTYLYMSGTTFITLGLGDVTPLAGVADGADAEVRKSNQRAGVPASPGGEPPHPAASARTPAGAGARRCGPARAQSALSLEIDQAASGT